MLKMLEMHELNQDSGHERITLIDERDLYQWLIESAEVGNVIRWTEHNDVRIEYTFH